MGGQKEWIPPWWQRETYESKMRGGKPEFTEYQPPPQPEQLKLLEKDQRDVIEKMAGEIGKYLK